MATLTEDIVNALRNLGGEAPLNKIYEEVRKINPSSKDPSVRNSIETHSSDSHAFEGIDLFYSAKGIGGGVWGLRVYEKKTPHAIDLDEGDDLPAKHKQEIYRILRDTQLARRIKVLHENKCQICGERIKLLDGGYYSEAHHIKPLGGNHKGPDVAQNILVLCPNHHVELDYGVRELNSSTLRLHHEHTVSDESIRYHNRTIFGQVK